MTKLLDKLALLMATGLGSGYSPLAPGTAGSVVGLLLFLPLVGRPWPVQLGATLVVTVLGVFAAQRVATLVARKDPGLVVVDEVAGQWITFVSLPFTPAIAVAGFLLFRAMDIVKPWPARALERLPGGVGIMADDVAAGIYAQLLLRVGLAIWPVV
ncbi:MAG: phosphatidylglycerophosphatase A [Burkholderiales bacterium]